MTDMSRAPGAAAPFPNLWANAPDDWPGVVAAEAWMDIGSEWWSFAAERFRANVETRHRLMHCTNPIDVQVVWMRHGQRLMEDYRREAGRLAQLAQRVPGAEAVLEE